jgi:preprotein translocase subunit SecD
MAKLTIRIWILIITLFLAALMIFNWNALFASGVEVKSIERNSTAYLKGIRQGMIIQEINSKAIEDQQDYIEAISQVFISENETKVSIKTDKDTYIFLATNLREITIQPLTKTRIKTGLDLSGGTRAIIRPENFTATQTQIDDLVAITDQRLNAFGLNDVTVRSAKDLGGNTFMIVEIAGATPSDIKNLLGQQGKFEAKIANTTVFEGEKRDISDVCRNDAKCSGVKECFPNQGGYVCNFAFVVYLTEEAAQKHAEVTKMLSLDESGRYLNESIYFYVDNNEVSSLLIGSSLRGQASTEILIEGSGTGTTREEAIKISRENMNRLQTILLTGSLPYKLEIVKLDTISPTLGQQFKKNIIFLGVIVFCIISIALFVKYRRIKVTLAVILTMFSEAFLTLAIASFIKWNLDASAIAGIIAGMGTGVNDQIVIIDETVTGEQTDESVKQKVKRALFIIVGAFLTIIAAMLPLFWAGAGMLRGFALTTIISVSVGIIITRPAFADMIKKIATH